jgi:hypothetical protein
LTCVNNLLAAGSFHQLAKETVRQRDYQLRLAQARHNAGVVSKSDVLGRQSMQQFAGYGGITLDSLALRSMIRKDGFSTLCLKG